LRPENTGHLFPPHAHGEIPLEVVLKDTQGHVIDPMEKRSSGELCRIEAWQAE